MAQSEAKKDVVKNTNNNATKQATDIKAGNGGVVPPKDKQFGQPNGNPRHNGAWKKTDTLRYKWEQLLKLTYAELIAIKEDTDGKYGRAEQMTAEVLLDSEMKTAEKIAVLDKLATQVYGFPKAPVEVSEVEAPIPLSPRKKKAK